MVTAAPLCPSVVVQLFVNTIRSMGTQRHQKLAEDAEQMKVSPLVYESHQRSSLFLVPPLSLFPLPLEQKLPGVEMGIFHTRSLFHL